MILTVDSSVFIKGESGVGKEVIAKFIHENCRRSSGPLLCYIRKILMI